jgi:hypothetical protein
MAMNIRQTDEFIVRLYYWAIEDTLREIKEGFPLIKTIRGTQSLAIVNYLESLSQQERFDIVKPLIKRMHKNAMEICGESLTDEDSKVFEAYRAKMIETLPKYREPLILAQYTKQGKIKRANKRALTPILRNKLLNVCGDVVQRD